MFFREHTNVLYLHITIKADSQYIFIHSMRIGLIEFDRVENRDRANFQSLSEKREK